MGRGARRADRRTRWTRRAARADRHDGSEPPSSTMAHHRAAGHGGRIVVVGLTGESAPVHPGPLPLKELDVLGTSCCLFEEFVAAADRPPLCHDRGDVDQSPRRALGRRPGVPGHRTSGGHGQGPHRCGRDAVSGSHVPSPNGSAWSASTSPSRVLPVASAWGSAKGCSSSALT